MLPSASRIHGCPVAVSVSMFSRRRRTPKTIFRNERGIASVLSRKTFLPRDVVIIGAARTPIGSFCGSLSEVTAIRLGAAAISAALGRARVEPDEVDAVVMGQALPAGCGLHAVRQASLLAELPPAVDCTGINKACASGLKAVMVAAQAIALGQAEVVVAGGMESMSRAPYLLSKARQGGYHYGDGVIEDSALNDGLWDKVSGCHLGSCAEMTARDMGIDRHEQDLYAIQSYRRAAGAWQGGALDAEVAPMRIRNANSARGSLEPKMLVVGTDEEYSRLDIDTVASLPPVFDDAGTITAASASSLNDGAAVVVLASLERAQELGVGAVARIVSFADYGVEPQHFATAPNGAVRRALQNAGMSTVDFHEIHEAFAVVALANARLLNLDESRMNVNGGAVALGHPLGASGARILCSLLTVLEQEGAETGCASIANGGGGASAMIVERFV